MEFPAAKYRGRRPQLKYGGRSICSRRVADCGMLQARPVAGGGISQVPRAAGPRMPKPADLTGVQPVQYIGHLLYQLATDEASDMVDKAGV